MAQFFTILPILVLFILFSSTVCPSPSGDVDKVRRDRASYIDSSEYLSPNLQKLAESTTGSFYNRPRKPYAPQVQQYQQQQQQQQQQQWMLQRKPQTENVSKYKVDETIKNIFKTDFGPGLTLLNNTQPFVQPKPYKNTDYMQSDQPYYTTSPINTDKAKNNEEEIFKNASNDAQLKNPHLIHFPTEKPDLRPELTYAVDTRGCTEGALDGKPFCTSLRNYPDIDLEKKLKKLNLDKFFGEDLSLPQNISQRMNNDIDETFLCKSHETIIYPQAAMNKDYNWLLIVNMPNYKQGIRIEECENTESACDPIMLLPERYKAYCKQNYIYRSLLAVTPEGTVQTDQFKLPSCCKCVIKPIS